MPDEKLFLSEIQSDSADARFAAWRRAGEEAASAIPQLGKLAASDKPGVAKAAQEALSTMTHAVGKDPKAAKRPAVVKGLLELTGAAYALPVRVHALRLLSGIAGEESVAAIAREIHNPELREEVVYCLERIPGPASIQTLIKSYPEAKEEFKPRFLAAFGHRKAAEAMDLGVQAMSSPNKEIAMAGLKALARIGRKPATLPGLPDVASLTEWEKIERADSLLRYADEQAKVGNLADAMNIYRSALERPEEHWQCAGVIGLAKLGTPEAAAAILPKLKSDNRKVRLTAERAWKGMAG